MRSIRTSILSLLVLAMLVLLSLLLAGCPQGSTVPPTLARVFPTVTPTPVPLPTPTREDETVIPFETIAINDLIASLPVGGEPEIVTSDDLGYVSQEAVENLINEGPTVFLVTSSQDVAPFQIWLLPEIRAAIATVDFEQYVVIAFFAGVKSNCCDGYISRIATNKLDVLTINAVFRSRSSGNPAETYPIHIVKIQRQDVPFPLSPGVQIQLETERQIIN